MTDSSNKRIAKNTAMLYFRMLFLTCISLYTVRITLDALGVIDYGIYSVVASVVASLSFLNGTLTSASQRFLSYHLGNKNYLLYSKTFSLLLIGFLLISIILLVIGEIIGIFFIDDWLNIPHDRLFAAKWVFQTSMFTFIFHLLVVPYSSSIVANERMSAFAHISIIDGILKLLLVYLLITAPIDRLIYYGILTLIESMCIFLLYLIYCRKVFLFCNFQFIWDKKIFQELTSYTGWNLFGSISGVLITQGQGILLNIYFGPIIITAKAIADKINNAVISFSTNFLMAVDPQIVKSWAANDRRRSISLVMLSSKLSFYVVLIFSFPLSMSMGNILKVWIGSEATNTITVKFANLSLIYCLITALEIPITQIIRASGNVRNYQLYIGIFTLLYIPIATLVLYLGAPPISTMIVLVVLYLTVHFIRIYIAHKIVGLNIHEYFNKVIYPIFIVLAVTIGTGFLLKNLINPSFIYSIISSLIIVISCIWILGLSKDNRRYIINTIKSKITRN